MAQPSSAFIAGVIEEININKLKPAKFPLRSLKEDSMSLRLSIELNGLLHPLIVRPVEGGFEVVAGTRRFEACKALKFRKAPCLVVDLDDKQAFEISLTENVQRESLTPFEEAHAFEQYVEKYGWGGISDLARRIGKSVSYVSRRIKLLSLPPDIQEEVLRQHKSPSILSEILAVEDVNLIKEISAFVFKNRLSEKDTRMLVKTIKGESKSLAKQAVRDMSLDCSSNVKVEEWILKKLITVLKMALVKMGDVINESINVTDWRFNEVLLERRYALHQLIDSLIVIQKKIHR